MRKKRAVHAQDMLSDVKTPRTVINCPPLVTARTNKNVFFLIFFQRVRSPSSFPGLRQTTYSDFWHAKMVASIGGVKTV